MQAVFLAAGMGKRLQPVTAKRSKAMAPALGRPLIERALMPFAENGVRDFIFVISADDTEIRPYFDELTDPDISVQFVVQHERLGMAHALGLAAPLVNDRFVLSSCDSLVGRLHVRELLAAAEGADGTLSLLEVEPALLSRSAVVELDGNRVRRIVEKPTPETAPSLTASLPHYVFSLRMLQLLAGVQPSPRGEYELQDAIQSLIDEGGSVIGVRAAERFQVSTPDDLLRLTQRLFAEEPEYRQIDSARIGNGTSLVGSVHVERGAAIGDHCEIGPRVVLESGCRIGDGAVIRRSIVLREARVGDGETIENRVVI
jgi:NDP-sugar pyrophosphorylase family protein